MRMALRVRENRGDFTIRLAQETVCRPCDQPACRITVLHQLEQRRHPVRRQGEIFPHRPKIASRRFLRERLDDVLNKSGEKLDLEDDRELERDDKEKRSRGT